MTDHFDKIEKLGQGLPEFSLGETSCFCSKFDPELELVDEKGRLYRCLNCHGRFLLYPTKISSKSATAFVQLRAGVETLLQACDSGCSEHMIKALADSLREPFQQLKDL
jgi:hypothetical protein